MKYYIIDFMNEEGEIQDRVLIRTNESMNKIRAYATELLFNLCAFKFEIELTKPIQI